jgi:23S rRNA pseudoU1915 N3-methylase RlmH
MKQESVETLKTKIATSFRKHGDKQALIVMDKNPRTYTGNQVADEIERETEFGVECISTVINLTVDLLSRDKVKYEPKK